MGQPPDHLDGRTTECGVAVTTFPVAQVELVRAEPGWHPSDTWSASILLRGLWNANGGRKPSDLEQEAIETPIYRGLEPLLADVAERVRQFRRWWPELQVQITHNCSVSAAAALARAHGLTLPR